MMMKYLYFSLALIISAFFALPAKAQDKTSLTVTNCPNAVVQKKIEENGSRLLTSFNTAFSKDTKPALNFGGISKKDIESIYTIYEIAPFKCLETVLIERVYQNSTGYQVRNIPVLLKDVPKEDSERDIVINFDKDGNILDIFFALEMHDVNAILSSDDNEVTDLRKRQIILDFVENYRTAHNRRDIKFISQVFSNNALIITGRVVSISGPSDMGKLSTAQITYQVRTKDEYISNLKKVFNNNKSIDIRFDSLAVQRHPKYNNIFGVTFKQYWNTSGYSDVGFVFLNIDFADENKPLIKVRTWQPTEFQGRPIDPGKIFGFDDFEYQ